MFDGIEKSGYNMSKEVTGNVQIDRNRHKL